MTVHGVALLLIYILIGYCIGFMRGSMFTKKDYIQIIKILYEDEKPEENEEPGEEYLRREE